MTAMKLPSTFFVFSGRRSGAYCLHERSRRCVQMKFIGESTIARDNLGELLRAHPGSFTGTAAVYWRWFRIHNASYENRLLLLSKPTRLQREWSRRRPNNRHHSSNKLGLKVL